MDVKTIVLICFGGVFAFILFMYILIAAETAKMEKKQKNNIVKSYSDGKLAKMEYDLAMYDDETKKLLNRTAENSQVTIDEIMGNDAPSSADAPLFAKIEDEGVEEIKGNFKP